MTTALKFPFIFCQIEDEEAIELIAFLLSLSNEILAME